MEESGDFGVEINVNIWFVFLLNGKEWEYYATMYKQKKQKKRGKDSGSVEHWYVCAKSCSVNDPDFNALLQFHLHVNGISANR